MRGWQEQTGLWPQAAWARHEPHCLLVGGVHSTRRAQKEGSAWCLVCLIFAIDFEEGVEVYLARGGGS